MIIEQSHVVGDLTGVRFFTVGSTALGGRGDVTLWEPSGVPVPGVPIVLLLHGIFGSHWAWVMNGRAHQTASDLLADGQMGPLVIAMPSDGLMGTGSGYVPQAHGNPETWIVEEVPRLVRQESKWVDDSSPVFIGGLSMGGFGACRLGAKYPHVFSGISSLSSPVEIRVLTAFSPYFTVPRPADHEDYSIVHWMTRNRDVLAPVRFDCGVDDEVIGMNRKLHRQLTDAHIPHEFEELDGAHDWMYWRTNLHRTLTFFDAIARKQAT